MQATAITKQQLRQLRWLKSEIKLLREQIENMEFAVVTDMVKGSHREHPKIGNIWDNPELLKEVE